MSDAIFSECVEFLGRNSANASGKSDKFYEIIITGPWGDQDRDPRGAWDEFIETRRWGKYGTKGQTKKIIHYSDWSALSSARTQIEKKLKKGYTKSVAPLTRLASVMED